MLVKLVDELYVSSTTSLERV